MDVRGDGDRNLSLLFPRRREIKSELSAKEMWDVTLENRVKHLLYVGMY